MEETNQRFNKENNVYFPPTSETKQLQICINDDRFIFAETIKFNHLLYLIRTVKLI